MNLIQQSVFRQQSHQLRTLHARENYLKSFIRDMFYGELAGGDPPCGRPLVAENPIEQRYLEKSIEQVELYGDVRHLLVVSKTEHE